jgi:hypothetical protein
VWGTLRWAVAEPHISREGRSPLSLLVQVSGVGAYLLLGSEEPTMPTSISSLFLLIVQESPLPLFFFFSPPFLCRRRPLSSTPCHSFKSKGYLPSCWIFPNQSNSCSEEIPDKSIPETPASPYQPSGPQVKYALPECFNGDPLCFSTFYTHCINYILLTASSYSCDREQTGFIGQLLYGDGNSQVVFKATRLQTNKTAHSFNI